MGTCGQVFRQQPVIVDHGTTYPVMVVPVDGGAAYEYNGAAYQQVASLACQFQTVHPHAAAIEPIFHADVLCGTGPDAIAEYSQKIW